jgi:hypothetical protein
MLSRAVRVVCDTILQDAGVASGRLACDTVIMTGTGADSSTDSERPKAPGRKPLGKPRRPSDAVVAAWITGVLGIVGAIAAALLIIHATSHSAVSESATVSVSRTSPSPLSVVEAYLAAVNSRNWPKAWQIGGKHLNKSYSSMVAGFRNTEKDVLLSFKQDGDRITADIAAYHTNGTVHYYALHYIVQRGIIIGGLGSPI